MSREKVKHWIEEDTRAMLKRFKSLAQIQKLKFYSILYDMLNEDICRTKREIFYMAVPVFKSQKVVDHLVKSTSIKLGVSLDQHITASLKGLYFGPVRFYTRDCVIQNSTLIPDMQRVLRVECDAASVVVIEKDALFSFIIERTARDDILFVCGKGYPCRNTIRLLQAIRAKKYGIFDFDPFGMHIFSTYKNSLHCDSFERLGITSQDLFEYKVSEKDLIDLAPRDKKYIENMMKRDECHALSPDLLFIKGLGKKLEMEAFITHDPYFFEKFINLKIPR